MTPWFLHLGLRPIGSPHAGHGNVVEPFSTSGTPEAVQTVALSAIDTPLCTTATTSPSLWLRENSTI